MLDTTKLIPYLEAALTIIDNNVMNLTLVCSMFNKDSQSSETDGND